MFRCTSIMMECLNEHAQELVEQIRVIHARKPPVPFQNFGASVSRVIKEAKNDYLERTTHYDSTIRIDKFVELAVS